MNTVETHRIENCLRQLRQSRGISMQELSRMAKVPYVNIRLIETGKRKLAGSTLIRLSVALDVDARELLGLKSSPPDKKISAKI